VPEPEQKTTINPAAEIQPTDSLPARTTKAAPPFAATSTAFRNAAFGDFYQIGVTQRELPHCDGIGMMFTTVDHTAATSYFVGFAAVVPQGEYVMTIGRPSPNEKYFDLDNPPVTNTLHFTVKKPLEMIGGYFEAFGLAPVENGILHISRADAPDAKDEIPLW
jgi:hypothetical protein